MKVLINADDFGWNESCSTAIMQAFEKGFISTTTLMSTGEYFDKAVQIIASSKHKDSVGIHFDLTEGCPLTDKMKKEPMFCNSEGIYHTNVDRLKLLSPTQKDIVYGELKAQAEKYKNTGLVFHHADSHHHIHTAIFIMPIVLQVMKEYSIPQMRIHRNIGEIGGAKKIVKNMANKLITWRRIAYSEYFGSYEDFLGTRISLSEDSTIEIMCHPDIDQNGILVDRDARASYDTPYGKQLEYLYRELGRVAKGTGIK